MGNHSTRSAEKKISRKTAKTTDVSHCRCTSHALVKSSTFSIDKKSRIYCCQSRKDLAKLNIESFLNHSKSKSTQELLSVIEKCQLEVYLKDYLNRLQTSPPNQTFKGQYSPSTIIYPCNGIHQILTDDLNLFLTSPAESILPSLSSNRNSSYSIQEQIRARCYFIPLTHCQIESDDLQYQQKSTTLLHRTHVVISLENNPVTKTNPTLREVDSGCVFTSNDSFQTGCIRVDQEKIAKHLLPFIQHSSTENCLHLSASLIQTWFNALILVNQTCPVARRFLHGDRHRLTCLLNERMESRTNIDRSSSSCSNLTLAAFRMSSYELSSVNLQEEEAFSSLFLSDMKGASKNTIRIDYEQYFFAFILRRWPKTVLDNYQTSSTRSSRRQWPSKSQMNIVLKKSLLLLPNGQTDQWEMSFDLVEESLFELMTESTLFFYALCQQLFSQTSFTRQLIKHSFLNYCEKYGAPFSNHQKNIFDSIKHFLNDLFQQIKNEFLPNYFNHRINLLNSNENHTQWFDHLDRCIRDRSYFSPRSVTISNRPVISEFLFRFTEQLYQILHVKRSEVSLNESILLDLHTQLVSDATNNQDVGLLNNEDLLGNLRRNFSSDFDANAELVHNSLNQIRRAQSSLVFHYTWTIFLQYLHTYYNTLWSL